MSNEVKAQVVLQATKDGDTLQCTAVGSFDMSGPGWDRKRLTLSTTEQALSTISSQGFIYVRAPVTNSDMILLGVKPSGTFIESQRIPPGLGVLFRGGTNAAYAKSLSGSQKIEYAVLES